MTDKEFRWPIIYDNYLEYTDRYGEGGAISLGTDGLPLQSAVLKDDYKKMSIQGNVGSLERELLLENGKRILMYWT